MCLCSNIQSITNGYVLPITCPKDMQSKISQSDGKLILFLVQVIVIMGRIIM